MTAAIIDGKAAAVALRGQVAAEQHAAEAREAHAERRHVQDRGGGSITGVRRRGERRAEQVAGITDNGIG